MQRFLCNYCYATECHVSFITDLTLLQPLAHYSGNTLNHTTAPLLSFLQCKNRRFALNIPILFKFHGHTYHLTSQVIIKAAQTAIRDYFNHIMIFSKTSNEIKSINES